MPKVALRKTPTGKRKKTAYNDERAGEVGSDKG